MGLKQLNSVRGGATFIGHMYRCITGTWVDVLFTLAVVCNAVYSLYSDTLFLQIISVGFLLFLLGYQYWKWRKRSSDITKGTFTDVLRGLGSIDTDIGSGVVNGVDSPDGDIYGVNSPNVSVNTYDAMHGNRSYVWSVYDGAYRWIEVDGFGLMVNGDVSSSGVGGDTVLVDDVDFMLRLLRLGEGNVIDEFAQTTIRFSGMTPEPTPALVTSDVELDEMVEWMTGKSLPVSIV